MYSFNLIIKAKGHENCSLPSPMLKLFMNIHCIHTFIPYIYVQDAYSYYNSPIETHLTFVICGDLIS